MLANLRDRHTAEPLQKRLFSRPSKRRNWLFSGPAPSCQAFDLYGICGDCLIACKRGLVRVSDLRQSDFVLTRERGYVRPAALRFASDIEDGTPRTGIVLETDAFGDGFPQESVGMGRNNKVLRYVTSDKTRAPKISAASMQKMKSPSMVRDCDPSNLCIVIFDTPASVQIAGIYIKCPAFATLGSAKQ